MFCTNCGAQIDDESAFCTECGEPTEHAMTDAAFEPMPETADVTAHAGAFATGAAGATTVLDQAVPDATDRQFAPREQVVTSPLPARPAVDDARGTGYEARPLERQKSRRPLIVAIVAIVVVAALIGGGFAIHQKQLADEEAARIEAEAEAQRQAELEQAQKEAEEAKAAQEKAEKEAQQAKEAQEKAEAEAKKAEEEAQQAQQQAQQQPSAGATPFYGVWIGSFSKYDYAVDYLNEALGKGFSAEMLESTDWTNLNPTHYYVITVGRCYSEADANALRDQAQQAGYPDAYVKYTGDHR